LPSLTIKGDPKGREKFNEFIINKIVLPKYNNTTYKIDDVDWDKNAGSQFEHRKHGMVCIFKQDGIGLNN